MPIASPLPDFQFTDLDRFPELPEHAHTLTEFRRYLHQHPELGWHEVQTGRLVAQTLKTHGLQVQTSVGKTGLWVDIQGHTGGKTIGFRADMDALPIQDAKQTSYASRHKGKAHLCGHDVHTTVALGTALALHQKRDQFSGKVRVFFQPNEEGSPSGAPLMIRDGVLDGLDAALAFHVDPTLPAGQFGVREGASTAACDIFRITIRGERTGHSARPHETIDTVWVLSQVLNHLYQMIGRINDARNPAILTVCQIQGGDAVNVIPQSVSFGGTLRVTDQQDRLKLRHHFIQIIEQVCGWYDAIPEIDFTFGAPAVQNDALLNAAAERVIVNLFGETALYRVPRTSMGAEDFAHYGDYLPISLIRLGTGSTPATQFPLHDARFDVDERAIPMGIKLADTLIRDLLITS